MLDQSAILVACHSEPIYRELMSPYIEICSAISERLENGYQHYVHGIPGLDSRPESFSELSVLFNARPFIADKKIVGFVHYRRIFSLDPLETGESVININFSHRFSRANSEATFLELYSDSIVIPFAWDQNRNLLLDFNLRHSILEDALRIACLEFDIQVSKIFGDVDSITELASLNRIYPCNMWIGNEEFYAEWTSILHPVLKKIESGSLRLPDAGYQSRWAGFISERLFTVYINLCRQTGKWNFVERPILLFIENEITGSNYSEISMLRLFLHKFKVFLFKIKEKSRSCFRSLLSYEA